MEILKNYDLTKLNTFGVSAKARLFVEIKTEEDLKELFNTEEFRNNEKLLLGGGSNTLFTKDFNGIVVLNKLKGIKIIKEDEEKVLIKSMSGEIWHDLVLYTVKHNLWGIENLSLIPGTVGASPIQNVGAYGLEIKNVLEEVEAFNIESGEKKVFSNEECEFGYRDSVFKNKLKGKYFITSVVFRLNKQPSVNNSYQALKDYLDKNKIEVKSSKDISDAVVAVRKSKLPDPKDLGNAGSCFKNVYISQEKLNEIKAKYGEVPVFLEGEKIKVPTAWFVDTLGWKGKKVGNVGVYEKQAIILVNYGGATGEEIKKLAENIIKSVEMEFGIKLEMEVNIV